MTDKASNEPEPQTNNAEASSTFRTSVPTVRTRAKLTFRDLLRGFAAALNIPCGPFGW
jgi:hypothetical protein